MISLQDARDYVEEQGVVLVAARGSTARLVEVIVGESIMGSWWAHARGKEIFRILRALGESPDVLVCRLVAGKVTFVHRRVWPALIRMSHLFDAPRLAQTGDEHTASGHHVRKDVPFPEWTDGQSRGAAQKISDEEALSILRACTALSGEVPA